MVTVIASFVLAFSMLIEFNVGGRLLAADVVSVLIIATSAIFGRLPKLSLVDKLFVIFASVWLATSVVTDLILNVELDRSIRPWSMILFLLVHYVAIRVLTGGSERAAALLVVLLLLGSAGKLAIGQSSADNIADAQQAWKFGYGAAVTALTAYIGARTAGRVFGMKGTGVAMGLAAAVNLSMNARSLFGQAALASLLAFFGGGRRGRRLSLRASIAVGCLAIVGSFGLVGLYAYASSQGLLGVAAQEKYARQAGNDLGLLFSGRTELLGSLAAIADSPLAGYGSDPRSDYYSSMRVSKLESAGVRVSAVVRGDNRIPSHSYLFGAWISAGIVGGLFWIGVLGLVLRRLVGILREPGRDAALALFVGLSLCWDILFSPFGLDRRLVMPAELNLVLLVAARRRSSATVKRIANRGAKASRGRPPVIETPEGGIA